MMNTNSLEGAMQTHQLKNQTRWRVEPSREQAREKTQAYYD